jgi:hypothetical protein
MDISINKKIANDLECLKMNQIISIYMMNINYIFGLLTNSFCVIVFINIIRQPSINNNNISSNMFKYLLLKGFTDSIFCFGKAVVAFKSVEEFKNTFILNLLDIIFLKYLCLISKSASVYFELVAAFDCFFLITRRFKFFIKTYAFYVITSIIICFSFTFYAIFIFEYKVSKHFDYSQNKTLYINVQTVLSQSKFFTYYIQIHSVLRDVIPLAFLTIVNILILIQLKKSTLRRRTLSSASSAISSIALNAERNKVKMILLTSLIYLLHIPTTLKDFDIIKNNDCNVNLIRLALDLSYTLSIIPYILYNNTFKKYIHKVLCFYKY